jgi:hypothetical protein
MKKNYFFTYGTWVGYPYYGGWTRVIAENQDEAIKLFRKVHRDIEEGNLRYAFLYDEDAFIATGMNVDGNYGNFEHETIELKTERAVNNV